jgi:hypothetical protein
MKYQDEMAAEDQRIKELRYNQKLRLNEIDAKAQELRYNEATGDVTAAQQSRADLNKLKTDYAKHQDTLAQQMATLRQNAASHDAQNATTLAAARERAANAGNAETKAAIQALKAEKDSINARFTRGGMMYQRTPQGKADAAELRRIEAQLAQLGGLGGTMAEPSAAGAGGKSSGWGKAQVVK